MILGRRSFLSVLTACLAALGLRRKVEAPLETLQEETIDALFERYDIFRPVLSFYDARTGKSTPVGGRS